MRFGSRRDPPRGRAAHVKPGETHVQATARGDSAQNEAQGIRKGAAQPANRAVPIAVLNLHAGLSVMLAFERCDSAHRKGATVINALPTDILKTCAKLARRSHREPSSEQR